MKASGRWKNGGASSNDRKKVWSSLLIIVTRIEYIKPFAAFATPGTTEYTE